MQICIIFTLFSVILIRSGSANFCRMVDAKLEAVPEVDIDEGIFKYVLIKVYGKEQSDGMEPSKLIVRGFNRAQWHSDIYDEVRSSVEGLGLDTECLGGGRIEHRPDNKKIKVYGYSQGFGKADHAKTRDILKTKYGNYDIEISDGGY
ncbi:sex-regulated protein janus-A-like isoform X2 [Hermetia illucens]|uniref:sex-regulated protein janus-A-like isoform X2 n=1 Tax=Hermetia illucens TaxID=343691 RepID=UPI0018CC15E9|nr:sex-regulated protein janus-A-like isoform X2 [Hermetia illucens]